MTDHDESLLSERRGDVLVLRMNRPEKLNALNTELTRTLCAALERAAGDASVRAIVLSGAGRAFCAGADTGEFRDLTPANDALVAQRADLTCRLHSLLRETPQPIISAVRGAAVGGGAGLAIGCDMMVAGEDLKFGYPELRHSLVPALVMTSLVRQIGRKLAFELVATGRMLDAPTMARLHLVNRVVAPGDVLEAACELALVCARPDPQAMQASKTLFHEVAECAFDDAMEAGRQMNIRMRGFSAPEAEGSE